MHDLVPSENGCDASGVSSFNHLSGIKFVGSWKFRLSKQAANGLVEAIDYNSLVHTLS